MAALAEMPFDTARSVEIAGQDQRFGEIRCEAEAGRLCRAEPLLVRRQWRKVRHRRRGVALRELQEPEDVAAADAPCQVVELPRY